MIALVKALSNQPYPPLCLVFRVAVTLTVAVPMVALLGCGGSYGPTRYDIEGSVTYGGKPVPGGRILFTPEGDNRGVASVAEISEGEYRTREGKGAISGSHKVTIFATNGTVATETHDNTLFAGYTESVVISAENTRFNFVVPSSFTARN